MKTSIVFVAMLVLLSPSVSFAASKKPSVLITEPDKGATYNVSDSMPISWEFKNVDKDMVVYTQVKLIKRDTSSAGSGYSSGSTFEHTVYAGDTSGGFSYDWESTIPGRYSVTSELRACNPKGCDQSPAGKRLSKKTKTVSVTVSNTNSSSPSTNKEGTGIQLLSPNGSEKFVAGSGKKLPITWNAWGVPTGAQVCVSLEKQGGGMFTLAGGKHCKKAKNGEDSITGKLVWENGYNLSPGRYWVHVNLVAQSNNSGKDGGNLAHDASDSTFILR